MNKNVLTLVVLFLMLVGVMAGPSSADTLYFDPPGATTGSWDVAENWHISSCTGDAAGRIPEPGDTAIICSGQTCNLGNTQKVASVTVNSTAILNVNTNGVLQLETATGGTSTVDGTLNLTHKIEIYFTNEVDGREYLINGAGAIVGASSSADLLIEGHETADPHRLVLSVIFRGAGEIGNLDAEVTRLVLKNAVLRANINGTLLIHTDQISDEAGTGNSSLKVTDNANAVLEIDLLCTGIDQCISYCLQYTEIDIIEGKFLPRDPIKTEQRLIMEPGGSFDFTYSGADINEECN